MTMTLSDLIPYLIPLLAAIVSFFLGRFLKIKVTVQQIVPVMSAIFASIFRTEKETVYQPPPENINFNNYREELATEYLNDAIKGNPVKSKVLKQLFGSAGKAIHIAFPAIKSTLDLLYKKKR